LEKFKFNKYGYENENFFFWKINVRNGAVTFIPSRTIYG